MRTVKIFIAGSKRLKAERDKFKVIANNLQIEYCNNRKALNIQVLTYENFDYFFDKQGQQSNYNSYIETQADIVYVVLDGSVGGVTQEEFETAYQSFTRTRTPKICIFSRQNDERNREIEEIRKRIGAIGQYYVDYTDLQELEIKIERSLRNFLQGKLPRRRRHPAVPPLRRRSLVLALVLPVLILFAAWYGIRRFSPPENAGPVRSYTVNGVEFKMIEVPAGHFMMGGSEPDAPLHEVHITENYLIGQTEVTQELWAAVMNDTPSVFRGRNLPVDNVSWEECVEFIERLNALTGKKFRLPTEAEWEYAARGGGSGGESTLYSGSDTLSAVGWNIDTSGGRTHPVMSKAPNRLGIYDTSGNVWEWCQDLYAPYGTSGTTNPQGGVQGLRRVRRGGSWRDDAPCCLSAFRSRNRPSAKGEWHGVRLAADWE